MSLGADTSSPTGKFMVDVIGTIAELERGMTLERQRIAGAKAEGKYKGREPTARARSGVYRRVRFGTNLSLVTL